jgi:UDP-N-acetylmuramoyl-L-alanyl-D-glutamate--2,6-diaminopimelate ligase
MKLRDLLRDVDARPAHGDLDTEITAVTADSRLVKPGALFVAVPGLQTDGAKFVDQAISKGAAAVVFGGQAPTPVRTGEVPVLQADDARKAVAIIAANFYGHPADKLSLVGVTGTSGKTTTTKMIESIFDAHAKGTDEAVGLIGTIEYRAGDERLTADRTTPDAVVLQEWFAKMADAGVRHAVMEVSSHALALKRTYGIKFAAAVFTNLSRDHFDFHKDFDDYFAAKRILFDQIPSARAAVVNRDDPYGLRLIEDLGDAVTFGMSEADITPAPGFEVSVNGLRGKLRTPIGDISAESNLLGAPNLSNWMAAVGAAIVVGIGREAIEAGIRNLQSVRGRFERVAPPPSAASPTVIVDYAHKPDALEKLLRAVRDVAPKHELVLVFGCGGDRDKGKRPQMGEIAIALADKVIVTSDNPRSENPDAIIDDILRNVAPPPPAAGAGKGIGATLRRITDRREAIARAIEEASDGQFIVIAGKGHETYQVVGDRIIHFDDREEAELALKKRAEK